MSTLQSQLHSTYRKLVGSRRRKGLLKLNWQVEIQLRYKIFQFFLPLKAWLPQQFYCFPSHSVPNSLRWEWSYSRLKKRKTTHFSQVDLKQYELDHPGILTFFLQQKGWNEKGWISWVIQTMLVYGRLKFTEIYAE